MRRALRRALAILPFLVVGVVLSLQPGCTVGYLAQQGYFQAELLAGREPIDKAIEKGHVDAAGAEKLELIRKIKSYGKDIGLSATNNYETISPKWDRTIWNLSACDPVSFRSKTWWFPIVGTMPYLGFFRRPDADRWADPLRHDGWDVYLRTAGAYSTLGWFRDPVLPGMLKWDEYDLAETVLHELAHATLWVPGSAQFNESFAGFVGEEAAMNYMVAKYGADGAPVVDVVESKEDGEKFRLMMHQLYQDLDAVYKDGSHTVPEKVVKKHQILAALPSRVQGLGLHHEDRYLRSVRMGTWNNARIVQYRTYNRSREWFEQIYLEQDRDVLKFIHRIGEITHKAGDPYEALAKAVGAKPEPE
jgi:predicted aminopeptidase